MKNHTHLLVLVCLLNNSAFAEDKLVLDNEHKLLASCRTLSTQVEHTSTIPCAYYIKGFLSGLWNMKQIVAAKLKEKDMSTWVERRANIRFGRTNRQVVPTYFAHFCLPDKASRIRIFKKLSNVGMSNITTVKELDEQIVIALNAICTTKENLKK